MSDEPAFDAVHARLLLHFPHLVRQLGGNPEALLARAGGSIEAIGYGSFVRLLDLAAAELGCSDFGLRLAQAQSGSGIFGPLGQVMRRSRNFGEALGYVAGHAYAHSLAARIWQEPIAGTGAVFYGHDILAGRMPGGSQAIEQVLLLGHLAAGEITGGRARVRRVDVRHQPLSRPEVYRRHFGCEVRFGCHADGVVFAAADLAAPIVDRDGEALARVSALIEARFTRQRPPLHAELRGVLLRLIGRGDSGNTRAAAALGLHPRTLHRRLRAEGISFQRVKDEVRRDLMLYLVRETELDFLRISQRLGLSEQAVLTRLCRRWFGLSPTGLRAGVRAK